MVVDGVLISLKQELQDLLDRARYLLRRTYPLVQEEKLFLDILRILLEFYERYEVFLFAILQQQGIVGKDQVQGSVGLRWTLLAKESQLQELLGGNFHLTTLVSQKSRLQELLCAQKEGPADFARKKEYVICEKNYKVQVISEFSALEMLRIAEEFGRFL